MSGSTWRRLISSVEWIGADEADDEDVRLQKRLLVAIALMVIPAAFLWSGIYLSFDEPLAGSIPLSYGVLSVASIVVFGFTRRLNLFRFSQLVTILLAPFLLMLALGGFVGGSAVFLWSLLSPLGAMLFAGRRQAIGWFAGFLGLLAISIALEPSARSTNDLPTGVVIAFFAMNIGAVAAVVFVLLQYFIRQLEREQDKSRQLLLNVLPGEVVAILKEDSRTIADQYQEFHTGCRSV